MIKVDGVKLKIGFTNEEVVATVAQKLKIKPKQIVSWQFVKLSIDARKKPDVFYVANVAVVLGGNLENKFFQLSYKLNNEIESFSKKTCSVAPVVVGFGPAGMFCALYLARMGLKPIVIEQGASVEEREQDVLNFWEHGVLNRYSNVQFGEGGAGTFSDGKLNTNLSSQISMKIAQEFVYYGAPKEILYTSKPHIGSDNLKNIVKNIRMDIIAMGGEVLFNHKLLAINEDENNKVLSIFNTKTQQNIQLSTNKLILALGHSARDTFKMLYNLGVKINQKPFAMGVRIEQKQEDINIAQYGEGYDKRLPSADYKLVEHLPNGRSVFTFCMCPGGVVVASSSAEGEVVTNGMSYFARDKENANSALLVNVNPEDFNSSHPLAGLEFQEKYEKLAFELAGKNYTAPYQTVGEFLGGYSDAQIMPTYKPNVKKADLTKCLPKFVSQSLKEALPKLNSKLKGFAYPHNLLIGIESRSSSPITIVRDEHFQCNLHGIYPVGEGAGYAGGIVSSAIDGIKVAKQIYSEIL